MLIFAAGTQGWFITKNRWYDSVLLLLVAFTLFRPGFWMDKLHDPYQEIPLTEMVQALGQVDEGSQLRLRIMGEDGIGQPREFVLLLPVPSGDTGEQRLEKLGLELMVEDGKLLIDNVAFGSQAADLGLEFDQEILRVRAPTDRIQKEWMWIPGLLLLGFIAWLQSRRRRLALATA